ncbi:MAG: CDP-alcohol phosphatidyltransferase family protein [Gammaproteobacteria bacterium]|nr:CDP-alcohol phosphatidyltransferase family protein [Gammaproteobacteria bacterium]
MRHLPNLICLLRIVLIWPVVAALQRGDYVTAFLVFVVAAVSDGLDGYLAKRFGWTSALGRFLDPLADKLLLVTVFLVATWQGLVPVWLTAAVVARDVLIGFGALVFRMFFGPLRGRPTRISKINTALQITFLIAAMLRAASGFPPAEPMAALAVFALATTLLSGADYTITMVRRALVASPDHA